MSFLPTIIGDTLANLLSGMGMLGRDKSAHSQFMFAPMTRVDIENAFRADWMARKIVSRPAQDTVRAWRSWQASAAQITALEAEEHRLGLRRKLRQAILWGRLYGGGALIIGDGADPSTPFDATRIGKGGIKYLIATHRYELTSTGRDTDPLSPNYGGAAEYRMPNTAGAEIVIHPSRVIKFVGAELPDASSPFVMGTGDRAWGDSILQAIQDAIKHAASSDQGIAQLVQEAAVDVIKMPNLLAQVGTAEYRGRVIARYDLAMTMKSIANTLILDGAETYEKKQVSFQHLPETSMHFLQVVCGAADFPATILLGTSPKGLNGTGDGETRNYYDGIAAYQGADLAPAIAPLDEALIRSALGSRPAEVFPTWLPLWQLDAAAQAKAHKDKADAVNVYVATGLFHPEALATAIANMITEDGLLPGFDKALADAGEWDATGPDLSDPSLDPEADPAETTAPARGDQPARKLTVRTGDRMLRDAAPRPAFVTREVLNAAEIRAWARREGIPEGDDAEPMRVIVAFSRTPIDWFRAGGFSEGELKVGEGGPRIVERASGEIVLQFASWELGYRARFLREELNASWEYAEEFTPQLTVGEDEAGTFDVRKVAPYVGKITLGPELWSEIMPDDLEV